MPWGITGAQVDGMDVLVVGRRAAVAACRAGEGPYLLEAKTIATAPLDVGSARYRPRESGIDAQQHDCMLRQRLMVWASRTRISGDDDE